MIKKLWTGILLGTGILLMLTACGSQTPMENWAQEPVSEAEGEQSEGEPAEESEPAEDDAEEPLVQPEGFAYDYGQLPEREQKIYLEILDILKKRDADEEISLITEERLGTVFQCVMNDHPEIFYVQGYTFTKFTRGDKIVRMTFSGTYTMDEAEIREKEAGIEAYAEQCFRGLPENASQYDKVKYVYEYLIHHTEYNLQAENNQNICSVFLNGESVCQGYAKATQYLLNRLDVDVTLVSGRVENGEGHAWNLVWIDGNSYYVDTTWGDASYQTTAGPEEDVLQNSPINYDYLCVTTAQLERTHQIDSVVGLPECTATEANYYVKEGACFTEYDEEKLRELFDRKAAAGENYVTLKCSCDDVYELFKQKLIEEEGIFDYMQSDGGLISYVSSSRQLSLSFWNKIE